MTNTYHPLKTNQSWQRGATPSAYLPRPPAPAACHAAPRRNVRRPSPLLQSLPRLLFALILVLGVIKLGNYLLDSHVNRQTQAEIELLYQPQLIQVAALAEPYANEAAGIPQATTASLPMLTPEPTPMPLNASRISDETAWHPDAVRHAAGGVLLPEMQQLISKNPDLVGWIQIPDVVSAPVVYCNNAYYLTHDFYGRESSGGAIFLDERHPFSSQAQNLLLYGHNMRDGTSLGHLSRFRSESFWQEHCLIQFSSLYAQESYVVFAAMVTSTSPASSDYVNFAGHPSFGSSDEFNAYMRDVQAHTLYPWRVDVNASDTLLTLATCLNEQRMVVLSRKLRNGETLQSMRRLVAP